MHEHVNSTVEMKLQNPNWEKLQDTCSVSSANELQGKREMEGQFIDPKRVERHGELLQDTALFGS